MGDGFFVLFWHKHSLADRPKGAGIPHTGQSDVQFVTPPSSSGATCAACLALAWLCAHHPAAGETSRELFSFLSTRQVRSQ